MSKRALGIDGVDITPTFALFGQVSDEFKVGDNALGGAFGDTGTLSQVADSQVGVLGDHEQDSAVIG